MNHTTSNLVIIGNGFDIAHGLETKYGQFIDWLIKEEVKNPHPINPLFNFAPNANREKLLEHINNSTSSVHLNSFFAGLMGYSGSDSSKKNWSDIEGFYFKQVERCLDERVHDTDIATVNREFEIIKNRFEDYLVGHTKGNNKKKIEKITSYQKFFDRLHDDTLILNFNYTETVKLYVNNREKIVNIHGELKYERNPMIFGYAAKEVELQRLYDKNDNEFLFNIKQNCYGDAKSESKLNKFLARAKKNEEPYKGIRIFILGHSCGTSDEYILERIFNHEKVSEITIFYYDGKGFDRQHYEIRTNLKRVMKNRENEHKILNKYECYPMPQLQDNNSNQEYDFIHYYLDKKFENIDVENGKV